MLALRLICIIINLQEVEESKMVTSKSSKHLKSEGNKRDEKPLHAEVTPTTSSKKSKDGKGWEAVASSFNLELPAKSRSFNDQQSRSNVPKVNGLSQGRQIQSAFL